MLKEVRKKGFHYFRAYSLNTFYLTCPQYIAAAGSIFTLPVILRYVPGSDYGKLQFIFAVSSWLGIFTFARISVESKVGIANGYEGNFFYSIFTRLQLSIPVIIISILVSILFSYYGRSVFGYILLFTTAHLLVNNVICGSISQYLIAKELFKYYAITESSLLLLSQVMSAVAAYLTHNIIFMVCARLSVSIFLVLVFLLILLSKYPLWSAFIKKEYDSKLKNYGIKMLPANLFYLTRTNLSSFLVGTIFGFESLAVYSVAYSNIYLRVSGVVNKIALLLYRKEVKSGRVTQIMQKSKYFIFITIAGVLFSFIIVFLGIIYINFFLPIEYRMAKVYIIILMSSIPFMILSQLLTLPLSVQMNYRALSSITIFRTIAELLCIILLGTFFGIKGICFSILIGCMLRFLLSSHYFYKSGHFLKRDIPATVEDFVPDNDKK